MYGVIRKSCPCFPRSWPQNFVDVACTQYSMSLHVQAMSKTLCSWSLLFSPLTIKKNSWPVISVHFVRGPKWIDASKIKKPRSHATEHWHALTFQIHTHCTWGLMMMYVCIYVLTFKFNFGSSWSVYTRPCLKAKNNGYTMIIILSCVMHDTKLAHFPSGIGLCDLSLGE